MALNLKQAWRMLREPALLMSRIFKAKYFRSGDLMDAWLGSRPSHAWRSIYNVKKYLCTETGSRGDGNNNNVALLASSGEFSCKKAYNVINLDLMRNANNAEECWDKEKMINFWKNIWKLASAP
ncbi:hypothetical protein QQ045_032757 [Rhodiola kirilowii]